MAAVVLCVKRDVDLFIFEKHLSINYFQSMVVVVEYFADEHEEHEDRL